MPEELLKACKIWHQGLSHFLLYCHHQAGKLTLTNCSVKCSLTVRRSWTRSRVNICPGYLTAKFTMKLVIHFELISLCVVQDTVEQMWIKIFCGIVIKSRWIPVRPRGLVACKAITRERLHLASESSQQLPAEVWGNQIWGWISTFSTSLSWGLWRSAHTACLGESHFPILDVPTLSLLTPCHWIFQFFPVCPVAAVLQWASFSTWLSGSGGWIPVRGFAGSVLQLLVFLLMLALVTSPLHSSESPACAQDTGLDLVSPIFPDSSQCCWSSCVAAATHKLIIFMQQSLMTPRGLFSFPFFFL